MKRSKIVDLAKTMPPLHHSIPGKEKFNIQESEVLKWLLKHPLTWNYIWNNIKQSGAIKFDKDTGTWKGIEFEDND